MLCTSCGFENPDGMNFCGKCATPLSHSCTKCGFENPPEFTFCGKCSSRLDGESTKSETTQRNRQSQTKEYGTTPEAERRQLTVMFCDLVGSTSLSEQLDPEDLRDIVRSYQEACAKVIENYDGYIAQYLGDGLLVYFGYPLAHEDDAQRAVRAGLGIVGAVQELPLQDDHLQQAVHVRIGIHTGLVVVGEMGGGKRRDTTAIVGETPNIAARLQGIAEPNTVVISAVNYRLVEGLFDCQNLGMHQLKGISTPVEVHQVLRESGVRSRFEVAVTKGLTPLVGREQEVGILLERWQQAKEGMGQVVLISGEAGIGKSRLLQVLKERLAGESHVRIESRCSPYYQNSALYPVIDHLQRFLFKREDTVEEKLSKLEKALVGVGFKPTPTFQEVVPLFASLLSLTFLDRYAPLTMTPQRQKQKTMEALLAWLLKEAEMHPVLRIVEDIHWVDSSTLEYLSLLVEQVPTARIFTLLTFRPDFSPPWTSRAHLTQITLSRLAQKQVEAMVERVAGGKALPGEVIHQIVAKTDGIPLFVEELTKMVIESGLVREEGGRYERTAPLATLAIPSTLQDSLMARLDRLSPINPSGTVKEVAQLGATLGRDFNYELIQAVSPLDENTLQRELTKLVEAELLYQRGIPPNASFIFKHALIQEAAYQSLLKSKRLQYHQKIAQILEEQFAETVETQPELLAYHYSEGGLVGQAIPYWQRAGQRARQRSANMEAIGHLTKGLGLLKTLPDTPERAQQELDLQTTLAPALMATEGYASTEVEKAYARARELCQQVRETTQLFPVLRGLWVFYQVRAEHQTARDLAEQLLHLAQNVQDPALLLEVQLVLGATLFFLGELVPARAHLEQGMALYDPAKHRSLASPYSLADPGVVCLSYAAWALWHLGYPDQALKKSHEALTLAQELSHPFSLAFAMDFAAWLHQYRREWQIAQEWAEAAMTLSTEHGFPHWVAMGTILRGRALAEQGQGEEGIAQMRQGLAAWRATGAELVRPYFLALLAEGYRKVGKIQEGLTVVAEALDLVNKNGERFYEAEIYRLKGELLLTLGAIMVGSRTDHTEDTEKCFRQAIDIARQQSAKCLELRAVMSLSRLWLKRGKEEEARKMLADIYGWFTEGFDTRDLKEAKTLLEELS